MVVARAVILAAGRGTRLGQLTAATAKPMLEVGGRPLIDHIVNAIAAAGIRSLVVVTGHMAGGIEAHLARTSPIPISFVRQVNPDGTAGALRLVKQALGDDPFLLSWGDIYTAPSHFSKVVDAWHPGLTAAIGVNRVEDVARLSSVVFDTDMQIRAMVEKPTGTPPSHWNSSGVMILTAQIWEHIDKIRLSERGELELADVVARLIDSGGRLEAVTLEGPWFDIGTVASLEAARATFAK